MNIRKRGQVIGMVDNAHYLSIEEMFADHDGVDRRRIFEGQEGKTTRPTTSIAHDRASFDFTELGEVVPQSL